jgi:predicted nucleic acid-binding protein
MCNKPIFYDSDVLICFLEINEQKILKKLFSKIIIPDKVYEELTRKKSHQNVKNNLNLLINDGFVEIEKIEFCTPEYIDYTCMIEGYWTNDKPLGIGEAAAIALALKHFGIVASNNLSDVENLSKLDDIPILTFSMILSFLFELNLISKVKIESVWKKIIVNTKQILPYDTFDEYYRKSFKNDCKRLLKDYDFKGHYKKEKK